MVELPDDEEGPDGQRKYSTGEVLAFGELVGVLKDAVTALRGQLEARERERSRSCTSFSTRHTRDLRPPVNLRPLPSLGQASLR